MDSITPQPEQPQSMDSAVPSQSSGPKHFLNKKFAITFVVLVLLGASAYAGIWYWQDQQVAQEVVPTFTPRADGSTSLTASWKTYTNTKYGFEFKYPSNWKEWSTSSDKDITFYDPSVNYGSDSDRLFPAVTINVQADTFSGSIIEYDKSINPAIAALRQNSTEIIGGKTAYVYTGKGVVDFRIVFNRSDIYLFSSSAATIAANKNEESAQPVRQVFNQILSTFKFIDSVAGQFCGGIAGVACPSGYSCKLDGTYPDAGGTCVPK